MSRRESLARGVERLVAAADRTRPRITAAIPPHRAEVRQARRELLSLAEVLRADGPVSPRGVALVSRLLTDGTGPAYAPAQLGALAAAAEQALDALAPAARSSTRSASAPRARA
jgi:hypothetical protein